MSSKEIGIEEARKVLGDLVTAAQQGADIILTRNRRPVARITAYPEVPMTTTTTLARSGALSEAAQLTDWYVYIADGGYTIEQQRRLADALMDAQRDEFQERLPEGCIWYPPLSEVQGPVGTEMPDSLDALMSEAAEAVVARYAEIEADVLNA